MSDLDIVGVLEAGARRPCPENTSGFLGRRACALHCAWLTAALHVIDEPGLALVYEIRGWRRWSKAGLSEDAWELRLRKALQAAVEDH